MYAQCKNEAGAWRYTNLDLNYCLWNDYGVLKPGVL